VDAVGEEVERREAERHEAQHEHGRPDEAAQHGADQ
jgi:hypothetical protein